MENNLKREKTMKIEIPENIEMAFLGAEYIYGIFYNMLSSLDFLDKINRIKSLKSLEKQYKCLVKKYKEIERLWEGIKKDADENDESVKEFIASHDEILNDFRNYLNIIENFIKDNQEQLPGGDKN